MPLGKILLVGCGKMGMALLRRWRDKGLSSLLTAIDPATSAIDGVPCFLSAKELPTGYRPDIIFFAVKPQTLADIVSDYVSLITPETVLISILAGKPVSFFEKTFGDGAKVIRAMPNTPAAIGKGITAAFANKNVHLKDREAAADLLSAVGGLVWVEKEDLLNPITALSGSGPAYIFLLIETLTAAGMKLGIEPAMAEKLARQTVIGSAALAEQENTLSAETLRRNVTSPAGTTEAALKILMQDGRLQKIFDEALTAATTRAEELSR